MSPKLLVWNCQGCAHTHFNRILKEYVREFDVDVVVLLETRISGLRAKSVNMNLGFDYSHRVEAKGFTGGIKVMWKDTVSINIQLCRFSVYSHVYGYGTKG